jgi:hypothetical protein
MRTDLIWRALSQDERDVVCAWLDVLGLDDWKAVPAFRTLLPVVATLRESAQTPELDATPALLDAAARLGVDGESVARTIRRWARGGRSVRDDRGDAA